MGGLTSDLSPAVLEEGRSVWPEQSLWFLTLLWPMVIIASKQGGEWGGQNTPALPSAWGQTHLLDHECLLLLGKACSWATGSAASAGGEHLGRHHGH